MECYRRDAGGRIEITAMFPGYIFLKTDMDQTELHIFLRSHRSDVTTFFREVGLSYRLASGEDVFDGDDDDLVIEDLSPDETRFLDFLMDAGDEGAGSEDGAKEHTAGSYAPTGGLLKMSYGYCEKGRRGEKDRFVVVKGPLKAYESHIAGVNRHDRKAFLDFEINGRIVRAGFEVKPKRYYFPEDDTAPEVLPDGSEVYTKDLAERMMDIRPERKTNSRRR